MFGSKKNKIEEQIKSAFAEVLQQKELFETKVSAMEDSGNQIYTDISQVMENTTDLSNYAMQNIEETSALIHDMDDFSKDLKSGVDEYMQIAELVKEYHEAVTNLVEENKHYTTPAKYLTEAPARFRQDYQSYEEKVDEMAENSKQMGVMALNAAIEAGRMGVAGTQFVATAEEIRQTALGYERTALTMKEELQDAQKRISELEEFVLRLVSLVKDGNISTTRLMKKSMELNKLVTECSLRDFSEDMIGMRDKVVAIRNLEEEIAKSSERNQIQLSDIQSEMKQQKKELRELESDLSHVLDQAQEKVH